MPFRRCFFATFSPLISTITPTHYLLRGVCHTMIITMPPMRVVFSMLSIEFICDTPPLPLSLPPSYFHTDIATPLFYFQHLRDVDALDILFSRCHAWRYEILRWAFRRHWRYAATTCRDMFIYTFHATFLLLRLSEGYYHIFFARCRRVTIFITRCRYSQKNIISLYYHCHWYRDICFYHDLEIYMSRWIWAYWIQVRHTPGMPHYALEFIIVIAAIFFHHFLLTYHCYWLLLNITHILNRVASSSISSLHMSFHLFSIEDGIFSSLIYFLHIFLLLSSRRDSESRHSPFIIFHIYCHWHTEMAGISPILISPRCHR